MQVVNDPRSDLKYAVSIYGYDGRESIKEITPVAVIHGENDGACWHWLVKTDSNRFMYITGGCDYTGWDCRGHLNFGETFESLDEANLTIPGDDYNNRSVREILVAQATGKIPYGEEKLP